MATGFYNRSKGDTARITGYALLIVLGISFCCFSIFEREKPNHFSVCEVQAQINVNTASVAGLVLLPGIGEKLARRIIEYRDEAGTDGLAFTKNSDLEKVKGIGPKKASEISNYICFE